MFLEPFFKGQRCGWIEVVCGSMFSGKTEELIRRLKRAQIAEQTVRVFKPALDQRYHKEQVVSHDERAFQAEPIADTSSIRTKSEEIEVVGLDEAQFFDENIVKICQQLALDGKRVIVAGLDMDYRGVPFGPMPDLMAVAEYVTKVHAICSHCGSLATHSYRIVPDRDQVLVGEKDAYEARCRVCYEMGNILKLPKSRKDKPSPPPDIPGLM
jgi:thymidine kinase